MCARDRGYVLLLFFLLLVSFLFPELLVCFVAVVRGSGDGCFGVEGGFFVCFYFAVDCLLFCFILPCSLLEFEWLFELFYAMIFLSIDVQVDPVMFFILYLSFVILLRSVCSVLMPYPLLLLLLSTL